MLNLDAMKLHGKYWFTAIDDQSRTSFACIHPDLSARSACKALCATLRFLHSAGVTCSDVMTDGGVCYHSVQFQRLCRRLRLNRSYARFHTKAHHRHYALVNAAHRRLLKVGDRRFASHWQAAGAAL